MNFFTNPDWLGTMLMILIESKLIKDSSPKLYFAKTKLVCFYILLVEKRQGL